MKVGDRVRVRASVIVYHHPEHRNQPFDLKGMEGEVIAVIRDWNGPPCQRQLSLSGAVW
jgi:hypothetical protein